MKQSKAWQLLTHRAVQEGLFFLGVGLALLAYALVGHYGDRTVGWELSPYLFPLLTSVLLTALALSLICTAVRDSNITQGAKDKEPRAGTAWLMVLLVTAYFVLLPLLHFAAATAVFLVAAFWLLGERRVWLTAVLSLGTAAVLYFIFGMLLHVMLP